MTNMSFEWLGVLHGRLVWVLHGRLPGRRDSLSGISSRPIVSQPRVDFKAQHKWKQHSFRFFGRSHFHHRLLYLHHHWHVSSKNVFFSAGRLTKPCHAANIDDFCLHSSASPPFAKEEIHSIPKESIVGSSQLWLMLWKVKIFYVICQFRTFIQPLENHLQTELS